MRFLLTILFWGLYFPLLRLLGLLFFWHSKVEDRERFEKKNKFESLAYSFKEINQQADLCFEFSSEGEFQQVAPLIDDALAAGKKIELVFFSPSVEKAIIRLAFKYPRQVRYLRFPFLRLFPFIGRRSFTSWITAKTLIMVRYDLFPELLLWAFKKNHELIMVWMTFKKERSQKREISFWKKLFLREASRIVYAGGEDLIQAQELGYKGRVFDFRIEQIKRRIKDKELKLKNLFPLYNDFKIHLDKFDKKIILGNAWPSDMFLLRDLPSDYLLVIVPHQLSEEILNLFRETLDNLGREVFEINNQTTQFEIASSILINKKGILCELYADFPYSYVGGGFEGSIHSVLEPLVAQSSKIACGPFHHRSTEYDIALECGKITEVKTPEQFLSWIKEAPKTSERDRINSLITDYESLREFVISC
jgi:3-deoxy-D-manno-octulosonic-acid transferase